MSRIDKQRSLAEQQNLRKEGHHKSGIGGSYGGDQKFQSSSMSNNPMMYSKIAMLQENGQNYVQKKDSEKERLEKLNEEIRVASQLLEQKRREIMDKKRSTNDDNPIRLEKMMKAMHLKIDNIRNKYSFALSTNNELVEDINKFRNEINLYKKIQEILSKKSAEAQKIVKKKSEKAKESDKKFEEGTKTLYRHQSEFAITKKQYNKEFQSVFNYLEEENRDQRIREKFGEKAPDGSKMKSTSPWSKSGTDFFKTQPTGFLDSNEFKAYGKKNTGSGSVVVDANTSAAHLEQLRKEVERHDEIFQNLVESCLPGVKIDLRNEDKRKSNQIEQDLLRQIISKFQDYDDQKNAIYQYISSLREENEQLEKQKKDIEDEIFKCEQLPAQIKKDPKVQQCFEIEVTYFHSLTFQIIFNMLSTIDEMNQKKQIEAVRRKKQKQDIEHKRLMLYINQLKMQIPVVFEKIGCDSDEYTRDISEEYGPFNYKDIDENNIIQYLGILEKRTNDLLQLQNRAFNNGKQSQQYLEQRKQRFAEESNLSLSNFGGRTKDEDLHGHLDTFKSKNEEQEKDKFMFQSKHFTEHANQIIDGLKNKKKKEKK